MRVVLIQHESERWHCAARREITRPKGGKLPKQKPCSPRGLAVVGKPMESSFGGSCWEPRKLVKDGKPSGVIRGECRGGLGGAAAPNRPPSAARREGGQNRRQRLSPRARRAQFPRKRDFMLYQPNAACAANPATQAAQTQLKEKPSRRRPKQNKMKKPPVPAGTKNHTNETPCFSSRTLHARNQPTQAAKRQPTKTMKAGVFPAFKYSHAYGCL